MQKDHIYVLHLFRLFKNKYHEVITSCQYFLLPAQTGLNGACGCDFCAEQGTGFEALNHQLSVTEQLTLTREKIEKKYHAHKFIAYFQNYTNTFLPIDRFEKIYAGRCKLSGCCRNFHFDQTGLYPL